jgi:hypothetical protein
MRDTKGFVETRQKLLAQKPNNSNNWITFAVAHHLDKNYDVAVQVLESYEVRCVWLAPAIAVNGILVGLEWEGGIVLERQETLRCAFSYALGLLLLTAFPNVTAGYGGWCRAV